MLPDQVSHSTALIADYKADRPGQVQIIHDLSSHVRADEPEPLLFEFLHGPGQVRDLGDRRVVYGSGGGLGHRRCQSRRPVLGDNHSMCSGQIGGADNRPQIVGVFNIIQEEEEGVLSPLSGQGQNVFDRRIAISRNIGNCPLMLACLRNFIQSLFIHKAKDTVPLFGLSDNGSNGAVVGFSQDENPVYRLP